MFIGVTATLLAGLLDFGQYQSFLFLIGSVFVPLYAVAAVDFFVVSRPTLGCLGNLEAASGAGDRLGLRIRRVPAGLSRHRPWLGRFLGFGRRERSDSYRPAGSALRWRR